MDEVQYRMPRRLKDKRRRGVLIINGVELAVLRIGGGDGGRDAGVIAHYPLSKVTAASWALVKAAGARAWPYKLWLGRPAAGAGVRVRIEGAALQH